MIYRVSIPFRLLCLLSIFTLALAKPAEASPANVPAFLASQTIYADALGAGWTDVSWGSSINLETSSPVHTGKRSMQVTYNGGWSGLQLAHPGLSTAGFSQLHFFEHGGSAGGQVINLYVQFSDNSRSPIVSVPAPKANQWSEVRIPLSSLNAVNKTIQVMVWQDGSGHAQPAYYLDDIALSDSADPDGPTLSAPFLNPRAALADGVSQIVVRAKVSDPQGLGDVQSVTVDAGAIGRGAVALKDDGRNNDGGAQDGVFGAVITAAPGTPSQEVMLVITARDQAGHAGTLQVANLVILAPAGGSVPAALPQRFGWGSNGWIGSSSTDPATDWQVKTGVPFDYLYQYITYGWEGWSDGFVRRFVNYAWDHHFIPVVTVYIMNGLPPICGEGGECYLSKLQNASAVSNYLNSLQRAAQEAAGSQPVIFNIEPDFYGSMQQYTNANPPAGIRKDDPTSMVVALNRGGYPNTLAGFGSYLIDLIHTNAPNALAAPMASTWATNGDPQNVNAGEAVKMAQRTAAFINAMGGSGADLLVIEWSDRDAGSGLRPWWDDADLGLPRHNRALLWENALSAAAQKRLLLWQVPAGNMNLDNTLQHFRDNRAAYAFNHPRELFDAGVIGLAFGAGDSNQTQVWTDGGFVAAQGKIAYDPPAAPTGLSLVQMNEATLSLHWNENSEPDCLGYKVTYRAAGGGKATVIDTRRRTSLTLMPPSGSWIISVAAYDATGSTSPASTPVTATTARFSNLLFLPFTIQSN